MGHNYIVGRTRVKIAESIEGAIAEGRLRAGDRLPPVRSLAGQLEVNRNTVTAAYRRLAAAGLVIAHGRRGTKVAPAPPSSPLSGIPHLPPQVRRLDTSSPDPDFLPPITAAFADWTPPLHMYGEAANLPALMDLASEFFAADGFTDGRLTVVNGVFDGVERLLRLRLRPGDAVGIEDPAHPGTVGLVRSLGLVPAPVEIDDDGPLPASLEQALAGRARAILITPRGQNPTGAAITPARAEALRNILSSHPEVLVIEDDHSGPVVGAPAVSVTQGRSGPWAILRSVSKFLGPDLRIAFLLGDATTVARVEGQMALGPRWVSHLLQGLVARVWRSRETRALIGRAEGTYTVRRQALLRALTERGIAGRGRSGLNVWIPVPQEAPAVQGLIAAGWCVKAGEAMRINSPPAIRISIPTLRESEAAKLADDLLNILSPSQYVSAV